MLETLLVAKICSQFILCYDLATLAFGRESAYVIKYLWASIVICLQDQLFNKLCSSLSYHYECIQFLNFSHNFYQRRTLLTISDAFLDFSAMKFL